MFLVFPCVVMLISVRWNVTVFLWGHVRSILPIKSEAVGKTSVQYLPFHRCYYLARTHWRAPSLSTRSITLFL